VTVSNRAPSGPLADLKALAEFHAARRIDPLLGLVPLSTDDLAARYARLVGPYPDEFRPAPPEPPPP
jgi:hypothetical protein